MKLDPQAEPVRYHIAYEINWRRLSTKQGVVERVDGPTDWVNSMVIVKKKDGSLRLYVLTPKTSLTRL